MSSVADVSSRLGEYMLKGWVLTDRSCPTLGCSVPLMRSPNGSTPIIHFCANCDDTPGVPHPKPTISTSDSSSIHTSDSHVSRPSTPPTEISSALSSPIFAPPVDTEESIRRREQSDRASSEIGKRLLKGWAMLGDECPNTRCFGVPLVRPPKAGSEKDPRKECVICGSVYVTEVDRVGRERLIPAELEPVRSNISGTTTQSTLRKEGKSMKTASHVPRDILPPQNVSLAASNEFSHSSYPQAISGPTRTGHTLQVLEESSLALQSTLSTLSERLVAQSTSGNATMDPISIGLTAETISKVTEALSRVRQLQWSENQVQRS